MTKKHIILAVETSAAPVSCALILCEGYNLHTAKVLAASSATTPLPHSRTLMPMVQATLQNAGIQPQDVTVAAVAKGPGSFTGVRIGVSAVKGFAFTDNIPCIGVSTLESMAYMWYNSGLKGLIVPVMDARCAQIYTAVFSCDGTMISRVSEDMAVRQQDMKQRLQNERQPIYLVGDGAELCYSLWHEECPQIRLAPPHLRYQQAIGVAFAAIMHADTVCDASALQPSYLRLPQAERELKARMQSKKE